MTKDREKVTEIIVSFMKDHNCFDQWKTNFVAKCERTETCPLKRLNMFLDRGFFTDRFISRSFTWIDTPQGHSYWSDLNRRLDDYIAERLYI